MGELVQPGADGMEERCVCPTDGWLSTCPRGEEHRIAYHRIQRAVRGDQPVTHANGAKSCIARALDGGDEPDDFWYEQAEVVLEGLTYKGFVVVKVEGKP